MPGINSALLTFLFLFLLESLSQILITPPCSAWSRSARKKTYIPLEGWGERQAGKKKNLIETGAVQPLLI